MALRLDTKGTYVRTMTKVEIRRNVLNISEVDRSLLGGVGVADQSTRLKVNYMESLKVGKWLRDHLYSRFASALGPPSNSLKSFRRPWVRKQASIFLSINS